MPELNGSQLLANRSTIWSLEFSVGRSRRRAGFVTAVKAGEGSGKDNAAREDFHTEPGVVQSSWALSRLLPTLIPFLGSPGADLVATVVLGIIKRIVGAFDQFRRYEFGR
ncbi:hypothetical protein EV129_114145 [Rhizobium azibense]|uniref:Uncharacterized protein n=1 Tax=Rhizobium azibense TaxID=1136135 RepID=A0A4R3REE7_9HYPH|nr:hypothetical protein EV129_114145 [Rhizobium azibense]